MDPTRPEDTEVTIKLGALVSLVQARDLANRQLEAVDQAIPHWKGTGSGRLEVIRKEMVEARRWRDYLRVGPTPPHEMPPPEGT